MSSFPPEVLGLLVCPVDKGELLLVDGEGGLYNPRLRLRYSIEDGIANLLPNAGTPVSEDDHARYIGSTSES